MKWHECDSCKKGMFVTPDEEVKLCKVCWEEVQRLKKCSGCGWRYKKSRFEDGSDYCNWCLDKELGDQNENSRG